MSGTDLTGMNSTCGQFHAGIGSPNFSIRVSDNNRLRVYLRTTDEASYTQTIPYDLNGGFVKDTWYNIVINIVFSDGESADGMVKVWINGVLEVDLSSIVTGYYVAQSTGNYWKHGMYRSTSHPSTMVTEYINMEVGLTDLTARITTPLATP